MFTIVYWLFLFSIVVNCGYAFYFFTRIFWLPVEQANDETIIKQPVSLIICAKNEAHNIEQFLPIILNQQYVDNQGVAMYEVIVVNDCSEDDTLLVLEKFTKLYNNLRVVNIPETETKGKKHALKCGVAATNFDLLLFTDADCQPASTQWVAQMVAPLHNGKAIVAGYSGYFKQLGLLNAFIRWETIHAFLQYSTYILAGLPYMAVGRNLACKKETFLKAQNTTTWNALPFGDDDLLVSIAGNKQNTVVVAIPSAFTFSASKQTLTEYVKQKQRHLSTGKYYNTTIKLLLGCFSGSHAAVWLYFFVLLLSPYYKIVATIMAIRCIIYWVIWLVTAQKTKDTQLIYFFPLFDLLWMVYNFAFSPYVLMKNKKHWK